MGIALLLCCCCTVCCRCIEPSGICPKERGISQIMTRKRYSSPGSEKGLLAVTQDVKATVVWRDETKPIRPSIESPYCIFVLLLICPLTDPRLFCGQAAPAIQSRRAAQHSQVDNRQHAADIKTHADHTQMAELVPHSPLTINPPQYRRKLNQRRQISIRGSINVLHRS